MNIKIENFHENFVQLYLRDAEARGFLISEAFFDKICNNLAEDGELNDNFLFGPFTKTGIEISGYSYDEEKETLILINQEIYQNEEKIETLTKQNLEVKFKRTENYFKKSLGGFSSYLEQTSDSYKVAYEIETLLKQNKVTKVKIYLLTDGLLTNTVKDIPNKNIEGFDFEYRIIDINYLFNIEMVHYQDESFNIDVDLPCLEASRLDSEYESYLAVFPGQEIARIYDDFGSRLLEQNVRTFLQFRGNVNKGLRTTISKAPEKFFAYNNGITTTASRVEFNNKGNISKIYDFQIVNGGQTTSSIYSAWKKDKLDLSKVFVQMKLSVVANISQHSEFVSNVARYANTQNKVNKSDFFSNSPFHKEMKNHSKLIAAPALNGGQKKTYWFYERVRGEYLNEQAYLTDAKKRIFQQVHPKNQLIDKTLLGKGEMAWKQKPYIVSKGAQYCFLNFADTITNQLEKDSMSITENYFKEAIAKIIIFRHLEKKISKASWYNGGYRAQIVAYTISYLAMDISKKGKFFNFDEIWNYQDIYDEFSDILMQIASTLYPVLLKGTPGNANIGSWSKKEDCWKKLKKLEIDLVYPEELLKNKDTVKQEKRKQKVEKKLMSGIETQIFAVEYTKWNEILEYLLKYQSDFKVTEKQMSILKRVSKGEFPSEAQSKLLYEVYNMSVEEGIVDKEEDILFKGESS